MNSSDKISKQAKELYDEFQFESVVDSSTRAKFYPLLIEFIKDIGPSRVLYDIGCGQGSWMAEYLRLGVARENIVAVDLAPKNVERLRTQGFNSICADMLRLPIADHCADAIICQGALHHTSDPSLAFTELVRITKPGGLIFLNVYNKWHPYYYLVHKATYPLRFLYWNVSRKVLSPAYALARLFFQPMARIVLGKFLDDRIAKRFFMDQVLTPRAHLFSRRMIEKLASRHSCRIKRFELQQHGLMIAAVIEV